MSRRTDFDPVLMSLLGDGVNRPTDVALKVEVDKGRLGDNDMALRIGLLFGDNTDNEDGAGGGGGGGVGDGGDGEDALSWLLTQVASGSSGPSGFSCCCCCSDGPFCG